MSQTITSRIEIAAPPSLVRAKFLDFPSLPRYSPTGYFRSLQPAVPHKPIEAGDVVHVTLEGGNIQPQILENSPSCFSWRGTFPLRSFSIFTGDHAFRFLESEKTKGHTTFVHEEEFSGPALWFVPNSLFEKGRKDAEPKLKVWNEDFKRWCEGAKQ